MKLTKLFFSILFLGVVLCSVYIFFNKSSVLSSWQIRGSLETADEIWIYEGLPHPSDAVIGLDRARKSKDVREVSNSYFYTPKIQTTNEVQTKLKELLVTGENMEKSSGKDQLYSFHADYAVAWMDGETEMFAQICYDCDEVWFIGANRTFKHTMNRELKTALKAELKAFNLRGRVNWKR